MSIFDIIFNIFEVLPKDIARMNQDTLIQAPLITAFFYFISRWFRAYLLRLGLFIFGGVILLQVFQGQSFLFRFDFYAGLGLLLPHIEVVEITYLLLKERTLFIYNQFIGLIVFLLNPFVWLYSKMVEVVDYFQAKQEAKTNKNDYEKYYSDDFKEQQKAEWEKEQARQDERSQREFREREAKREQQRQEQHRKYEEESRKYQEQQQKEKKSTSRWDSENDYEILGIAKTNDFKEVKKAYRKLAQRYHPDTTTVDKQEAEEIMKKINNAYERLVKKLNKNS